MLFGKVTEAVAARLQQRLDGFGQPVHPRAVTTSEAHLMGERVKALRLGLDAVQRKVGHGGKR